jgi:hypothetical protein
MPFGKDSRNPATNELLIEPRTTDGPLVQVKVQAGFFF